MRFVQLFWTVDGISKRQAGISRLVTSNHARNKNKGGKAWVVTSLLPVETKSSRQRASRSALENAPPRVSLPPPLRRPRSWPIDERNCSTTVTSRTTSQYDVITDRDGRRPSKGVAEDKRKDGRGSRSSCAKRRICRRGVVGIGGYRFLSMCWRSTLGMRVSVCAFITGASKAAV